MDRIDAHNLMLFLNGMAEGVSEQIEKLAPLMQGHADATAAASAGDALRDYFSQLSFMADAMSRVATHEGNLSWAALDDHIGVDVFIPGTTI